MVEGEESEGCPSTRNTKPQPTSTAGHGASHQQSPQVCRWIAMDSASLSPDTPSSALYPPLLHQHVSLWSLVKSPTSGESPATTPTKVAVCRYATATAVTVLSQEVHCELSS